MIETSPMTVDLALAQQAQNTQTALHTNNNTLDMNKIEDAAIEFEAVFITEMMKPMFEGIKTDGMFGGGKGEEVFRGFLLQEYGKSFARSNGLGIADHVKAAMIQMQDQANQGSSTPILTPQNLKNGDSK